MPYDRYPGIDENHDFAIIVRQALAKTIELRSLVIPMTSISRDNLLSSELWDGRVIANITTDRIERYDAEISQWIALAEVSDLPPDLSASLDQKVDENGGTMVADPTIPLGVVTKQYTDNRTPPIIVLGASDPVPPALSVGTVIIRKV